MVDFRPNQTGIHRTLREPGGPVFRHVEEYVKETVNLSRVAAPKDTGELAHSIEATSLQEAGDGLESIVSAGAVNHRTGENYAQSVHQGRGPLIPTRKKYMQFYWKRAGHVVKFSYIHPRRGRPFLIEGAEDANATLRVGRFRVRIERPIRQDGS